MAYFLGGCTNIPKLVNPTKVVERVTEQIETCCALGVKHSLSKACCLGLLRRHLGLCNKMILPAPSVRTLRSLQCCGSLGLEGLRNSSYSST